MKTYSIEVEDTVGEFYEEMAVVLGKLACDVMRDVLFKNAESLRDLIAESLSVDVD